MHNFADLNLIAELPASKECQVQDQSGRVDVVCGWASTSASSSSPPSENVFNRAHLRANQTELQHVPASSSESYLRDRPHCLVQIFKVAHHAEQIVCSHSFAANKRTDTNKHAHTHPPTPHARTHRVHCQRFLRDHTKASK